jgi:hypothetical protein
MDYVPGLFGTTTKVEKLVTDERELDGSSRILMRLSVASVFVCVVDSSINQTWLLDSIGQTQGLPTLGHFLNRLSKARRASSGELFCPDGLRLFGLK